jgi:hypothetical protein
VSCNLASSACCYRNSDFDETCAADTNCTFFGQSCAATADCPLGMNCCHVSLPAGQKATFWAVCTTGGCNGMQQYCDPNAATPGCLTGLCAANGMCQ